MLQVYRSPAAPRRCHDDEQNPVFDVLTDGDIAVLEPHGALLPARGPAAAPGGVGHLVARSAFAAAVQRFDSLGREYAQNDRREGVPLAVAPEVPCTRRSGESGAPAYRSSATAARSTSCSSPSRAPRAPYPRVPRSSTGCPTEPRRPRSGHRGRSTRRRGRGPPSPRGSCRTPRGPPRSRGPPSRARTGTARPSPFPPWPGSARHGASSRCPCVSSPRAARRSRGGP